MWKLAIIALFVAACTSPDIGVSEDAFSWCPSPKWKIDLPVSDITPGCEKVTDISLIVDDPCLAPTVAGFPNFVCEAFPDKDPPLVHCEHQLTEDFIIVLDITPIRVEYSVGACRYEFQ